MCVGSKSRQDLSWLGNGGEQGMKSRSLVQFVDAQRTRGCQERSLRQKPRSGWSYWSTEGVTDVPRDVLE